MVLWSICMGVAMGGGLCSMGASEVGAYAH